MPITASVVVMLLLLFNLLCALALIFVERKDPVTTMAWLLVLNFLPVLGMVFYLFFGRGLRMQLRGRLERKLRYDRHFEEVLTEHRRQQNDLFHQYQEGTVNFHDPAAKRFLPLLKMNFLTGHVSFSQENWVEIFTDGRAKYDSLLRDIRSAKSTINVLYFIFKSDGIGREIIAALTERAQAGVQVRLCYDDLGSITTSSRAFAPLRKAGGKVRRFFPLTPFTLLRANYRNHRKIVVVDGRVAYTGGMNVGDEHMSLQPKRSPWRDTHLRITGPAVHDLQALFLMDWYTASMEHRLGSPLSMDLFFPPAPLEDQGTVGMQVVHSGPEDEAQQIKKALIKLFGMARESILIQTPYFIPDQPFLEALQIAAQSGVKVTVMIPGKPDKKTVYAVTTSYIQELLDAGITVLKHPGFLHAKAVVVDGEMVTIGTCNMDVRSFQLHFEVNCFIYDTATAKEYTQLFWQDAEDCEEITPEIYRKRGLGKRMVESVCRLCAPLM